MVRGKHTCRILKEIRRRIAEANDIDLVISECHYKGDCLGTCPKCEAEVRYLEKQLRARSLAGKAIALAGLSAGMIFLSGCTNTSSNQTSQPSANTIAIDSPKDMMDSVAKAFYNENVTTGIVAVDTIKEWADDESFVPDPEKIYEYPEEYPKSLNGFIGLTVKKRESGYDLVKWEEYREHPKKYLTVRFVLDNLGRATTPEIIENVGSIENIRPYLGEIISQLPQTEPAKINGHKVKTYGIAYIIVVEDKEE